MFKCKHEGCSTLKHFGLGFCNKHHRQYKKYGRTFTVTRKDFNEVVDCGDHYELILIDREMKEVGRAKIDEEDLPKVKSVNRWGLDTNGYVYNSSTGTYLHRLVMDAKDDEEVDHKETGIESRSDNRKFNLRLSTRQENEFNKGKFKNNTSGFKGVYYSKDKKKWRAEITDNGKKIRLGSFNSPKKAANAYNKAAKELHGNFLHKSLITLNPPAPLKKRFYYAPGAYRARCLFKQKERDSK